MRIKGGARMVQQRKTGLNVRQLKERTSTITVDGKPREVLESEVTRKICLRNLLLLGAWRVELYTWPIIYSAV